VTDRRIDHPPPSRQLGLRLEHPAAGLPVIPLGSQQTSADAGASVARSGRARALERQVFDALEAAPATDEELEARVDAGGNTIRPRRRSLVQRGLVEDSGLTRATRSGRRAIVWKVCAPWDR
jgi:hypothetical protein